MNKNNLLITLSFIIALSMDAQTWGNEDDYQDNNWNQQDNRSWDQSQRRSYRGQNGRDNPYQDPNYYPTNYGYRGCPPPPSPPPSCRRNVVVVTPPPSFCAPVYIAPASPMYYRPYWYGNRPNRGYGYGNRRWRCR